MLTYLATSPQTFFSSREVSRRAGDKDKFREQPSWAVPILSRLLTRGLVEGDSSGRYRLVPDGKA